MSDKLREALEAAKEKLQLYRAEHCGVYVGGVEYSALMKRIDAALAQPQNDAEAGSWVKLSADTSWIDGRDVVLLVRGMEVSARYCAGEWSDETPNSPREYSGAVWSCFDDEFQLEIEEVSNDPQEWGRDGATHWRTKAAPPSPERMREALERCRTVLGNMALENTKGPSAIFNRWPISHEPLRTDARNLLPVIDEALRGGE